MEYPVIKNLPTNYADHSGKTYEHYEFFLREIMKHVPHVVADEAIRYQPQGCFVEKPLLVANKWDIQAAAIGLGVGATIGGVEVDDRFALAERINRVFMDRHIWLLEANEYNEDEFVADFHDFGGRPWWSMDFDDYPLMPHEAPFVNSKDIRENFRIAEQLLEDRM